MEEQIVFFNNFNQIIFDYYGINYGNPYLSNYMKDNNFDKYNDIKNILKIYEEDNINMIIDSITHVTNNKLNITKFNQY